MSVYLGNTKEGTLYHGSTKIKEAYYGSTKVYTSFTPQTIRFDFTGAVQTLTVPSGCTKLIVDCVGGGHITKKYDGSIIGRGYGGRVQCELSVTAGQTLQIYVGGMGMMSASTPPTDSAGYNGGGNGVVKGSYDLYYGSCGAGASDIRTSSDLNSRLVVAGGSGGYGSSGSSGSGGGLVGGTATITVTTRRTPPTGGTQTAGGTGGTDPQYGTYIGGSGSFGYGGGLGNNNQYSGAGGGGWYGGGSGYHDFPGAGGSSYTHPTLCTNVVHTQGYSEATGNGWIIITTSNQ